jgi:hypothetical protein
MSDLFFSLTECLYPTSNSSQKPLEIEILPSGYPIPRSSEGAADLLYEDEQTRSLAIPKKSLKLVFPVARKLFSSQFEDSGYKAAEDPDATNKQEVVQDISAALETFHQDLAFKASSVLLLFDPEYITAANYRKRKILALHTALTQIDTFSTEFELIIANELTFLTSLLTSPLRKHTKSPTLWSFRLWILQNFVMLAKTAQTRQTPANSIVDGSSADGRSGNPFKVYHLDIGEAQALLSEELNIIFTAAERHFANYYAWLYARRLVGLLSNAVSSSTGQSTSTCSTIGHECALLDLNPAVITKQALSSLHKWCLSHPRDVSGWSFLEFVLKARLRAISSDKPDGTEKQILVDTEDFVLKLAWKGEAVSSFLKAMHSVNA